MKEKEKENTEHEYCLRCGRKLRTQEARLRGYGLICFKKMQVDDKRRPLFTVIKN